MYTLTVAKTIKAPIDLVFDVYTDHEALSGIPGVRSAKLVREGNTERNGLGAIRELDCGAIWLQEEITGFERPTRMQYRIVESRPPSEHRLGYVQFEPVPEGTVVTWTTLFGVRPQAIGKLLDPFFGVGFGVAFKLVLRDVAKRVKARQAAGG
ncbi:MAG: SRPBCC family protein [Solirubrobacterales bacterium]|nr:SRPBCC family protein [Solirubrobacterales bacterium]